MNESCGDTSIPLSKKMQFFLQGFPPKDSWWAWSSEALFTEPLSAALGQEAGWDNSYGQKHNQDLSQAWSHNKFPCQISPECLPHTGTAHKTPNSNFRLRLAGGPFKSTNSLYAHILDMQKATWLIKTPASDPVQGQNWAIWNTVSINK